ncbi:lysophospholipid acyltransferase LPEAT2 [Selaginella moellendorffii]|uniref:lysophospholipid acyltransferase LPEAT2 n=1 Tax=Selaginella moellendorffii TaxID=88036 RepID=UPI000D1CBE70|nr:lysophospholipid acyltransferase LPEAT2 [Selaginella moellendorffii]|eukprot:XP_024529189.1 lysophospholipid acyltransferase LPEAT2 [Selaginella moellendorffii]
MAQDRQRDAVDAFPLGKRPSIGPNTVMNPFQGESLGFSPLEIFKTIVVLPIFLLRLAILAAALILAYCSVRCGLIGVKYHLYKPFSRWRRILLWPLRICARIAMFAFGYVWISIKGTPAPPDVAPIVRLQSRIFLGSGLHIFLTHASDLERQGECQASNRGSLSYSSPDHSSGQSHSQVEKGRSSSNPATRHR